MGNIDSEHGCSEAAKNKVVNEVMEMRWHNYEGPEYIEPTPKP